MTNDAMLAFGVAAIVFAFFAGLALVGWVAQQPFRSSRSEKSERHMWETKGPKK